MKSALDRPLLTYRTYRKTRETIRKSVRASNRDIFETSYSVRSHPSKSPSNDKLRFGKEPEEDLILSAPKRDL